MTKLIPGYYQSPPPKREVEMSEGELNSLFERIGAERFLKHTNTIDVITTLAGAKVIRQVKLDYNKKNKMKAPVKIKKRRKQIIRGNLRKI